MVLRLQHTDTLNVNCYKNPDGKYVYPGILPIRFVLESPTRTLPAATLPGAKDGSGELPPTAINPDSLGTPVSAVGFEPIILRGSMDTSSQDPNIDPRYAGIQTPEDEWCTDSCGVGSINLTPQCLDNNTISVLIRTGSVAKVMTITTTLK